MPRTVATRKALQQKLQEALHDRLGFLHFRENQEAAVIHAMEGRDVLVLANTGAGKSLCFVLPSLLGCGMVLVVSPLIALMQNQVQSLQAKGVAAEYLASNRPQSDRQGILKRMETGKNAPEIVFITPESVTTASFRAVLVAMAGRGAVALVAVDEAHCISSWGHDFRPHYRKLALLPELLSGVPVMALTATATSQVQEDIMSSLRLRNPKILRSSFNRPNIYYSIKYMEGDEQERIDDMAATLRSISNRGVPQQAGQPITCCAIIYARKRNTTEILARALSAKGLHCSAYHGGMSDSIRKKVLQGWTEGTIPIVAATIAFGMGIDKANVRAVIHFTMPKSLEGFYQESGRAGRDGLQSHSIMYYNTADAMAVRWLIDNEVRRRARKKRKTSNVTLSTDNAAMKAFNSVEALATKERCRRWQILEHFGEEFIPVPGAEGCCDWCNNEALVRAQMMQARAVADLRQKTSFGLKRNACGPKAEVESSNAMGGYKLEFEEENGFDRIHDDVQGDSGSSDGEASDGDEPEAASFAKDVLHQAKSSGYDVLEAMERAEQFHREHVAAQELKAPGGRRSKLLQRLGSSESSKGLNQRIGSTSSMSNKGGKSYLDLKEEYRSMVAQQLEKAMRKNDNLKDVSEEILQALAARMEKEAYQGSSSKPVYLSKITGLKRSATQVSTLEDLPGGSASSETAHTVNRVDSRGSAELTTGQAAGPLLTQEGSDAAAVVLQAGAQGPKEAAGKSVEESMLSAPADLAAQLSQEVESCAALVAATQEDPRLPGSALQAVEALRSLESYPVTMKMLKETCVNERLLAWKALTDQAPEVAAASKAVLKAWKRRCTCPTGRPNA